MILTFEISQSLMEAGGTSTNRTYNGNTTIVIIWVWKLLENKTKQKQLPLPLL